MPHTLHASTGAVAIVLAFTIAHLMPAGSHAAEPEAVASKVDSTTLHHKLLSGYQGWFRCPGDAANEGWRHWSRGGRNISPETVTFEMWPDVSDLREDERFPATGFTWENGSPAFLFSSTHPRTVTRHFEWMREYGLDGVFLQRFLVELRDPSTDLVLQHVRAAAEETGRVYAICYDLSGMRSEHLVERLSADWKDLVENKNVTGDDRYLHHDGRPVVFVWGFYSDRFGPEIAHAIIDSFQQNDSRSAVLIGGCDWRWRSEENPEWARAFRRLDVISPWNVGNSREVEGRKFANTDTWKGDLGEAKARKALYLPVIYPGFAWTNLKGPRGASATLPRLGGEFFWQQVRDADGLGIEMAYVAMFDEVDEGTAIFKVTNSPPREGHFTTYDGLPPDWYLRLAAEATQVIHGEKKAGADLPIRP